MSSDLTSLEADLRKLRPASLPPALLDRLDACASGTWNQQTPMDRLWEESLSRVSPAAPSPALMKSLEAAVSGTPFPAERKIVLFPAAAAPRARRRAGWLRAAALVALSGALAALLAPLPGPKPQVAGQTGQTTAPPAANHATAPSAPATSLVPAGFRRGLSETSDEGVVWRSAGLAHRVLKVVYKDSVTLRDPIGRIYQMEEPRVEYILVPAKID